MEHGLSHVTCGVSRYLYLKPALDARAQILLARALLALSKGPAHHRDQ